MHEFEGLSHAASVNPDGTTAVLVANTAAARAIFPRLGGSEAELRLPPESVTTLSWKTV